MKRTPRKERKSSDLSKLSKVSFADDIREYILQETREAFRPHPLSSASLDHSSDSGGNMRIFVSTPTGESIALVAEPFFTIDYLKMKIQEKVGVSSHRQRLVLPTGDQLLDLGEGGRNLSDYKIQNESTIRLLLQDPEPTAPVVTLDEEPLALDDLSDLFVDDHVKTSEENDFVPQDEAIMPNSFLDIPGNQDDDDNISVLTCATSYTGFSAISGNNSELCLPDILQDDTSVLTPRTTNYSIKYPRPRGHPRRRQPSEGVAATAIQRRWRRRRSKLVNRPPSLLETRPGGQENPASPLIASNDHQEQLVSKEETAEEQPTKNLNSQTPNIPSLATTTTQNDEQLYLPPPVPLLPVRNFEEETLYTAVAEARVSADCGSTLNTNERSLLIKQGRCPTCGIQTHRKSGMFKRRSLRPLSNEHVLMGRCLICNPINVVTREITGANASPFNAEEANNQATAGEHFDGGGQYDFSSAHMEAQVLGRESKIEESPNNAAHLFDHFRTPLSVPSLSTPKADDHQPNRKDSTPSAPSLNDTCTEPETGDLQQKRYDEREAHSSPKAGPRGEVERWLLSHLPALKKQDVEKYCRCLEEDGFDSVLMLDVLEEGDLNFMKKAHRRVLTKRLRSRPCVDP